MKFEMIRNMIFTLAIGSGVSSNNVFAQTETARCEDVCDQEADAMHLDAIFALINEYRECDVSFLKCIDSNPRSAPPTIWPPIPTPRRPFDPYPNKPRQIRCGEELTSCQNTAKSMHGYRIRLAEKYRKECKDSCLSNDGEGVVQQ